MKKQERKSNGELTFIVKFSMKLKIFLIVRLFLNVNNFEPQIIF